jgi:hypothetical protein
MPLPKGIGLYPRPNTACAEPARFKHTNPPPGGYGNQPGGPPAAPGPKGQAGAEDVAQRTVAEVDVAEVEVELTEAPTPKPRKRKAKN